MINLHEIEVQAAVKKFLENGGTIEKLDYIDPFLNVNMEVGGEDVQDYNGWTSLDIVLMNSGR